MVRRGIVDTLACVMNARREGSVLVSDVQEGSVTVSIDNIRRSSSSGGRQISVTLSLPNSISTKGLRESQKKPIQVYFHGSVREA